MKTKHVLIVLVPLAGSSVHVHSLSNVFSDAATGCTDTLAAAYGEVGDFDSAIRFQKQAIRQAQKEAAAIKDPERRRNGYEKEITFIKPGLLATSGISPGVRVQNWKVQSWTKKRSHLRVRSDPVDRRSLSRNLARIKCFGATSMDHCAA